MADRAGMDNPILAWAFGDGTIQPVMPGRRPDLPQSHWKDRQNAAWVNTEGPIWQWRWRSAIFDLRPEYADTDNQGNMAGSIPVNRSAALGVGATLRFILYSLNGNDPCQQSGLKVAYWECTNDQAANHQTGQAGAVPESVLFRTSEPTDCRDTVREGGQTVTLDGIVFRGGSLLYFTPPAEGIRYWQLWIQFTFEERELATNPTTLGWAAQASVY